MNKNLVILALSMFIFLYSGGAYFRIDAFQSPLVLTFIGVVLFLFCVFQLINSKEKWLSFGPYPYEIKDRKILLQNFKNTENKFLYFRNLLSVLFFPLGIGVVMLIIYFFSQFGEGNDVAVAKNFILTLSVFASLLILGYFIYLFFSKKIIFYETKRKHLIWDINLTLDSSSAVFPSHTR